MTIALDSETNGLDFNHGAKPYLITACDDELNNTWWEWDVDPLTREPQIPEKDLDEIEELIDSADELVLHNTKFDFHALSTIGFASFPWEKVKDTLLACHLVSSQQAKDLTTRALVHLGINLKPFEDRIKEATQKARRMAKSQYPDWRIAKKGLLEMPSAKDEVWKLDMWLPRAIAKEENYPEDHPWWTLCSDYANSDTAATIQLWSVLKKIIEDKDCWEIYLERLRILPILFSMEEHGIGLNRDRLVSLQERYEQEYEDESRACCQIAERYNYKLELPKASANNSLKEFCFGEEYLNLPVVGTTKGGSPSFDAKAKAEYKEILEGDALDFVKAFDRRSKRATSISYMESYDKFKLQVGKSKKWFTLYSSLNPTGTATLRMSSQNPNQQQISKKLDEDGRNLRYTFGPLPDREWWSLDYDNLELRIPAYECEEPAMLELFEHPDSPPFFGSYHMLIVSILHPSEWKQCLREAGEEGASELFKKKYKDTLYQWTKNGNFAELYGAVDTGKGDGTADRAFHKPGAQAIIAKRLKQKNALNQSYISFAQKNGFVYTLPDSQVNPKHGYPIECTRTKWNQIKPTVPLNYHVQGTACWVMMRAMIKVHDYFQTLDDCHIVMNVHDEIVLDLPKSRTGRKNLPIIREVKRLMESCGDDVGIKLIVGVDYNPSNWAEAKGIAV